MRLGRVATGNPASWETFRLDFKRPIPSLPVELFEQVLKGLQNGDLAQANQVSKAWSGAIRRAQRSITIKNCAQLQRVNAAYPSIYWLRCDFALTRLELRGLGRLERLTSLSLSTCQVEEELGGLVALTALRQLEIAISASDCNLRFLHCATQLQELRLIPRNACAPDLTALGQLSRLTKLDLSKGALSSIDLQVLSELVGLRALKLNRIVNIHELTGRHNYRLNVAFLGQLINLTRLSMAGVYSCERHLVDQIGKLTKLEKLNLLETPAEGVETKLDQLRGLTSLGLNAPSGERSFCIDSRSDIGGLKRLKISCIGERTGHIARICRGAPFLEQLAIHTSDLTCDQLAQLTRLGSLRRLKICNSLLENSAAVQTWAELAKLRDLEFTGSYFRTGHFNHLLTLTQLTRFRLHERFLPNRSTNLGAREQT